MEAMLRTLSEIAAEQNVLPGSSTNPTRPLTVNTLDERLDMLMVCRRLDATGRRGRRLRGNPHPHRDHRRRRRAPRPRRRICYDLKRLPGHRPHQRDTTRTWQTAHKMQQAARPAGWRDQRERQPARTPLRRQYTIDPAITHGIGRGRRGRAPQAARYDSLARGFFGASPRLSSRAASSPGAYMGDANASIPTPQPLVMRPMFGALGGATGATSLAFVSRRSLAEETRRPASA